MRIALVLYKNVKLSPFKGKAVEEESITVFCSTSLYALLSKKKKSIYLTGHFIFT